MSLARARDLVDEIAQILGASAIEKTSIVTVDVRRIRNIVESGAVAVVVLPPKLTFPTQSHTEGAWEIFVASGPISDQVAAWEDLDAITEALREPLYLEGAEPAAYQETEQGAAYPAYILSFTE